MSVNIQKVAVLIFKGARKQRKDAVLTISAWNEQVSTTRAPPKKCSTPVPVKATHSIGITMFIPPENYVRKHLHQGAY